jgi:CRISPR-associated protein Csc3
MMPYPSEDEELDHIDDSQAAFAEASDIPDEAPAPPQIAPIPLFQALFERTATDDTLRDFARDVVGNLSDELGMKSAKGGKFYREKLAAGAKNPERYGRDQSLRAHLINGVLPALRIARCLKKWGAGRFQQYWTPEVERLFIAGFIMHDYGKIDEVQQALRDLGFADNTPPREDQIAALESVFVQWCERLGLGDFLAPVGGLRLYAQDLISIAHNTQQLWGTLPDASLRRMQMPPRARQLATDVSRLADLLAYVAPTPRDLAADKSINGALKALLNLGEEGLARFTYHHVAENRGVLVNFIHNAVLKALRLEDQRVELLYAPSGVVYLERGDAPPMPAPEELVTEIVNGIRQKVARALVSKKKAVKLGKDGLRTDELYKDVFDLREFVAISANLIGLIRGNAPQYLEKLVSLGYPHTDTLPVYDADARDPRLRQMAEWASVVDIQFEERAPELANIFCQQVLQLWKIDDLSSAFEQVRTYKPLQREGTGIRYQWYWAAAYALSRRPGTSPEDIQDWLQKSATEIAALLPSDLPASALPNQEIWRDLTDYITRILTLGGQKSAVAALQAGVTRYARAKTGRGGAICAVCGEPYTTRKPSETAVAFQPGVYTARVRIGASDNKRSLCSICALEQLLRQLFVENIGSGGAAEGERVRYLSLYPSYFFTPETLAVLREAYQSFQNTRLTNSDLRRALTGQPDLKDARFWTHLQDFTFRPLKNAHTRSILRYDEDVGGTFLMIGLSHYGAETDVESWIMPTFYTLLFAVCLDVKVVVSEGSVPLMVEASELPETLWLDGAHPAIPALIGDDWTDGSAYSGRLHIDLILPALARLTAGYLVHMDTEAKGYEGNWRRLPPIAQSLAESPWYVLYYLDQQARQDERAINADRVRRYLYYARDLFTIEGDNKMTIAEKLVDDYRKFYRAKRIKNSNSVLRPMNVVADALLTADPRLFSDTDALIELAYGELSKFMKRVIDHAADGYTAPSVSPESEAGRAAMRAAMQEFCDYFVTDVYEGIFNKDVAALRGKQLNLLKSACEAIYRDKQYAEWEAIGKDEEADDDETDE